LANKPDNEKTLLELLLDYGKNGVFIPDPAPAQPPPQPPVGQPPTTPDDDGLEDTDVPHDPFLASLTDKQRLGRSLLKTGALDAIEDYLDARQAWLAKHPAP